MNGLLELLLGLTLFGSFGAAIVFILAAFFMFFVAESEENGWINTALILILFLGFYFLGDGWTGFWEIFSPTLILSYLGIGLVYAFIRVFFFGRDERARVNKDRENGMQYSKIEFRKVKSNVFRWWWAWPISGIHWFFSKFVKDIANFVYQKLESTFTYVLMLGANTIEEKPLKKEKNDKTNL